MTVWELYSDTNLQYNRFQCFFFYNKKTPEGVCAGCAGVRKDYFEWPGVGQLLSTWVGTTCTVQPKNNARARISFCVRKPATSCSYLRDAFT